MEAIQNELNSKSTKFVAVSLSILVIDIPLRSSVQLDIITTIISIIIIINNDATRLFGVIKWPIIKQSSTRSRFMCINNRQTLAAFTFTHPINLT